MSAVGVLTLVKGRAGHLAAQCEGLRRSAVPPAEHIVVNMGGAVTLPAAPWPSRVIDLPSAGLPLAAARNLAAAAAASETLLFLDVDCIPAQSLLGAVGEAMAGFDGLLCADIRYLAADAARPPWTEVELSERAAPHPHRRFPACGVCGETNYGLFWSLAFAVRRPTFNALGGFDEAFTGYGAEDTDLAYRARDDSVPLAFLGGVGAFHQHHGVFDPPLQHFADIVANARTFHARWGEWPMRGWLEAFAARGLIAFRADRLDVIRVPRPDECASARQPAARRF